MADITHLKIARRDGERAYAPAVARVLGGVFRIKTTPRGWRVEQSGENVTLTSIDPYTPAATLTRKLTMVGVEINVSDSGPLSAYYAVGF